MLLAGAGERMVDAIFQALDRRGVSVERCAGGDVLTAVRAAAPDLVLLLGDAATDGGVACLRALSQEPLTAATAVAVLCDAEGFPHRMEAFRHGAVAAISRSASSDDVGERLVALLRELPQRTGSLFGDFGEATLDELTELVKRELRTGILSVEGPNSEPVRIVFGAGKPVAQALHEFVAKLRPLVARTEPLRYELLEGTSGSLQLSAFPAAIQGDSAVFRELAVLVVDDDAGRADGLAQVLRGAGANVIVTGTHGNDLSRARELDPDIAVLDQALLEGTGFRFVRMLRSDVRLRWASVLLADWTALWPNRNLPLNLPGLAKSVEPLLGGSRELARQLATQDAFDTRLEHGGPGRLLRALGATAGTHHLTLHSARATIEVDVADGLVAGALGTRPDGPPMEGLTALAGLLALSHGRVRVERREHPLFVNIMAPPELALGKAFLEEPPIPPSLPPSVPGYFPPAGFAEAATSKYATIPVPSPMAIPVAGKTLMGPGLVFPPTPPAAARAQQSPITPAEKCAGSIDVLGATVMSPAFSPGPALAPNGALATTGAADLSEPPREGEAAHTSSVGVPAEAAREVSLVPPGGAPRHRWGRRLFWIAAALATVACGAIGTVFAVALFGHAPNWVYETFRTALPEQGALVPADVRARGDGAGKSAAVAPTRAADVVAPVQVEAPSGTPSGPRARGTEPELAATETAAVPAGDLSTDGAVVEEPVAAPARRDEPEAGAVPEIPTPVPGTVSSAPSLSAPAVVDPSRSANSVIREGERLIREGQVLAAGPYFERALALRPGDNHALIGMAQVHLARGDVPSALHFAEEAVRLRPRRVPYRLVLANAHARAGQAAEARAELSRILHEEPRNKAALELRATLGDR